MAEVNVLVAIVVHFFFYMIAIFFPELRPPAPLIIQPKVVEIGYWETLSNQSYQKITFDNVNDVVTLDNRMEWLVVSQTGDLWVVRVGNSSESGYNITHKMKIRLPRSVGRRGGIWHATVDQDTGRLFLTVNSVSRRRDTAVYYTQSVFPLINNASTADGENIEVTLLCATADSSRTYHGTCIDPVQKVLFITEGSILGHDDGSILVYSFANSEGKISTNLTSKIKPNSSFSPWACSVFGRHMVISDHATSSVQLYLLKEVDKDNENEEYEDPTFVRNIATEGSELGQVAEPRDVNFDHNGNLLVADWGNKRIQIFDDVNGDRLNLTAVWQSEQVQFYLKGVDTVFGDDEGVSGPNIHIIAVLFPNFISVYKQTLF